MSKTSLADAILNEVGGAANVTNLTHCATRLRFVLDDKSIVDQKKLDKIDGVLGVVDQGENFLQVIIGMGVADVFEEINGLLKSKKPAKKSSSKKTLSDAEVKAEQRKKIKGKNKIIDSFFDFLSDSFRPIIGVLVGASLLLAFLNLLIFCGVITDASDTPWTMFLNAIAMSVFYFIPVIVIFSAFRKLKLDPIVGACCMLALFTPHFLCLGDPETYSNMFANAQGLDAVQAAITSTVNPILDTKLITCNVFGFDMLIYTYNGNVFVPLLMAGVCKLLDMLLKKIIPSSVHLVFVPFLEMLLLTTITAFILGPASIYLGNGLSYIFNWLNDNAPFIFALAIPMMYPFLVPLGLHWPINALILMNVNELGYDFIQGPMGCWNFACFGATFGVLLISLREKNKQVTSVAGGALVAGLLGGISEPSLYGIHLRYKKIYPKMLIGCAAGGITIAVLGYLFPSVNASGELVHGVIVPAFAYQSLLTIPLFSQMWVFGISIAVSFVIPAVLINILDYRDPQQKAIMRATIAGERIGLIDVDNIFQYTNTELANMTKQNNSPQYELDLKAPVDGEIIALKDCGDHAFAIKALGEGIAIQPAKKSIEIKAPVNGLISSIANGNHAIALTTDEGAGILIHVGIDTLKLHGEGFELLVENGDEVKAGDAILKVDIKKIDEEGYKTPVIMTVVNTNEMKSVTPNLDLGKVTTKDAVIKVLG